MTFDLNIWLYVYVWLLPSVLWHCWLGIRKSIWPLRSWVVRCWHGYLSGARCKWFAYGPADATAAPSSLAPVKSRMVVSFWCQLTQVVLEKRQLTGRTICVCMSGRMCVCMSGWQAGRMCVCMSGGQAGHAVEHSLLVAAAGSGRHVTIQSSSSSSTSTSTGQFYCYFLHCYDTVGWSCGSLINSASYSKRLSCTTGEGIKQSNKLARVVLEKRPLNDVM